MVLVPESTPNAKRRKIFVTKQNTEQQSKEMDTNMIL
jgi:hypothetical protein